MTTYSILVTNNAPGCNNDIEQQLSVTGCTTYIVRLASNSNALGPFNVYVDTVIYYSAQTRTEMLNGVVVNLSCATPTPSPTPTLTPTQTQTPSLGITPNPTSTPTQTSTETSTPTQTPTQTQTQTPSTTPGTTPNSTPTQTQTQTPTNTITQTPTNTATPTATTTSTPTQTPTQTQTTTQTPTQTQTQTPSTTPGTTPNSTPTQTQTQTPTNTITQTPTNTATSTATPTNTTTNTATNSATPTATATATPTATATATATPTMTQTATVTQTMTQTATVTQTMTQTATVTQTMTQTPTVTRTQTPTQTQTTTQTPTQTQTQTTTTTLTPTPSITPPGFQAYIFAEPQNFDDGVILEDYMTVQNSATWGGYQFYGTPGSLNYSSNLDLYAHFSEWTSGVGNYKTAPQSLTGPIRQAPGTGVDAYGCEQNQYTFGTIEVSTTQVNVNIQYFYSIWIPLNGVGGSMNNMTVDIGSAAACTTNIINDGIPESIAGTNVVVTSGAAIPAGTYRVLWLGSAATLPLAVPPPPSSVNFYFKGESKT